MADNMNAVCYCGHRMSQHSKVLGCGICQCKMFTERLAYKCDVCNEPIPIRDAPNGEIVRLRFKDDGRNYAHKECLKKDRSKKLKENGVKTVKGEWDGWMKDGEKIVKPDKMVITAPDAEALLAILARFDVFTPDGEIDESRLENIEKEKPPLLALLKFAESL